MNRHLTMAGYERINGASTADSWRRCPISGSRPIFPMLHIPSTAYGLAASFARSIATVALVTATSMLAGLPLGVRAQTLAGTEIAEMSLEQLAAMNVTSVSRRAEPISDAAASVYVVTADAIRRSGVTTLFEAVRLAPNMLVSSDNGVPGYVSARGMNGVVYVGPNKILMLIDGRSAYTSWFSGIFWDIQDVMLEDVERIEVVSGPAGTLWGVNAVNGVINVITRPASQTQGSLVSASGGKRGQTVAFRHGGTLGEDGHFRVYGKHLDRDRNRNLLTAAKVEDDWRKSQVGFRVDWSRGGDQVTILGNAYKASEGQAEPGTLSGTGAELDRVGASGANLTARWNRKLEGNGNIALQAYFDHNRRDIRPVIGSHVDVADIELQHQLATIGRHTLTWGANLRSAWDRVDNTVYFAFLPASVRQNWSSVFAQDEIGLGELFKLTLGTRLERNPYTGLEVLPSARLAWKVSPDQLVWGAASRAVRAPARLDADITVPGQAPYFYVGNPQPRSEIAHVFEIGYRGRLGSRINYSATVFHNRYSHLGTIDFPEGRPPQFGSAMKGRATGLETWATWQVSQAWRLSAGFTTLRERFAVTSPIVDPSEANASGNDPSNTWQLRSAYAIAENRDLDLIVRHVGALSGISNANPGVSSYTAVDARFAWRVRRDLELSLVGRNLLGTAHEEFGLPEYRAQIPMEIMAKAVWTF